MILNFYTFNEIFIDRIFYHYNLCSVNIITMSAKGNHNNIFTGSSKHWSELLRIWKQNQIHICFTSGVMDNSLQRIIFPWL